MVSDAPTGRARPCPMNTLRFVPSTLTLTVLVMTATPGCSGSPTTTPSDSGDVEAVEPSADPPGGLAVADVPMFVSIGSDDNAEPDGVAWLSSFASRHNPPGSGQAATFDGTPLRMTFFHTSRYVGAAGDSWIDAFQAGHEIGNHTETHATSNKSSLDDWGWEIEECERKLTALGIPQEEMIGFRTPFLGTNADMITAVATHGFAYDCSLEEGFQSDQDGTNFLWPYTLDGGSPGNELLTGWGVKTAIEPQPGLWELPVYALIVPPDDKCEEYGVEPGFRQRMFDKQDYFDLSSGKITGFDYNLVHPDAFGMTGPEFAATLKYSFDQRLAGNRAPFLLGAHAVNYAADKPEYREALESFIDHALEHPDVRVVAMADVLAWLRDPVPLDRG